MHPNLNLLYPSLKPEVNFPCLWQPVFVIWNDFGCTSIKHNFHLTYKWINIYPSYGYDDVRFWPGGEISHQCRTWFVLIGQFRTCSPIFKPTPDFGVVCLGLSCDWDVAILWQNPFPYLPRPLHPLRPTLYINISYLLW